MLLGGARHGVVVLVHRYRSLGEVHQGVTVAGGHPGMDLGLDDDGDNDHDNNDDDDDDDDTDDNDNNYDNDE